MSKRTLFLHIGAQRTATTSIQQFMYANIDALMSRGIFYPFRVDRHIRIMDEIMPRYPDGTPRADVPARPAAEVGEMITRLANNKRHSIDRVVLSDEGLSLRADLTPLQPLCDQFDVKVIFFLRRQDVWLESWYFQNIKWQWNPALAHLTFDQFLAERARFHWIDYDRHVTMLENLFGAENLQLVVFEPDEMPQGPVVAFCNQIGLGDLTGLAQPGDLNASLSPMMVEFLRHLPLDRAREAVRNDILEACLYVDQAVLGHGARSSERILTAEARAALLAEFAPSNGQLARRHFGREALFRAPVPGPETANAQLSLPQNSAALMRDLVAPLFARLIETNTLQRRAGQGRLS